MDLPEPVQGEEPQSFLRAVGVDFFEVMGVPVLEGRDFNDMDSRDGAPVVVVNETLARRMRDQGHRPDHIISSPANRALTTARR
mgnify:CR=1 FL=1